MKRNNPSIRAAILAELKRQEKTQYWLAQQAGMHVNVVYKALAKGRDMRVSTADRLLKALGLVVRSE